MNFEIQKRYGELRKGVNEPSKKGVGRARLHLRNCRKCDRLIKTTSMCGKPVCLECNNGNHCGHEGGYIE